MAGVVLLGLPGAVVYAASKPVIRIVYGTVLSDTQLGDRAWPLAIFVSLLWPLGIVACYLVAFRLGASQPKVGQILIHLTTIYLWAAAGSLVPYTLARND